MNAMLKTIENNYEYREARGEDWLPEMEIRAAAKNLALLIEKHSPPNAGREKALAMTNCEQALFWAREGLLRYPNDGNKNT